MLSLDLCGSRRSSSQENHRSFRFASSSWGRSSDTTAEIRRQVVHLCANGLSTRAIASIIAANQSTVSRILKRHRETGSVEKKPRSGRPRKSTPRDDRHLKALSLANRFKTAR